MIPLAEIVAGDWEEMIAIAAEEEEEPAVDRASRRRLCGSFRVRKVSQNPYYRR